MILSGRPSNVNTGGNSMSEHDVYDQVRETLNGRTDQPIVFGVCQTLAARFNCEAWVPRLIAIVLGLFYSWFALIAYVILGVVLTETEPRTRGFFSGLAIIVRENAEKLVDSARGVIGGSNR
jgi:phage shock protein PspC (stress-responsive transcriptional regulator)